MRSFKSKVLSACAWAVPAFAAILPAGRDLSVTGSHGAKPPLLALDTQDHYAQATFSVPCAGCLGSDGTSQDDESLILTFKAHSSDQPCGASNITLNGVYLLQEWIGDAAYGSGSFQGVSHPQKNAWSLQHTLDLEWESTCLNASDSDEIEVTADDAAQVLTVTINAIDGKPLDQPSGFTISYKQLSPPELLRLERAPNRAAGNRENAESWRAPPVELRLSLPAAPSDVPVPSAVVGQPPLEDEIRELRALAAQIEELQKALQEKTKHLKSHLQPEAHHLTEELRQCKNITCAVKAVAHKAHGAWRVIFIHFRPDHHPPPSHMGHPKDRFAGVGNHKETTIHIQSVAPPPSQHHIPQHPHGPGHRPLPPPKSPYVIALEVVVGVLCCGCLVTVIRQRCCSLRTRTERAARQEELANERAYRRAARRHAWRNWWRRTTWTDRTRIADYEEKRALINHQESILEDAMQDELRQLRQAHGFVNSLVQAEEGRLPSARCHYHTAPAPLLSVPPSPAPYSPASSVFTRDSLAELPSRPLSRTSSLPSYRSASSSSEPPAYESDEDTSEVVANGFRCYSPSTGSGTSSRWTPESSVVDVSPRPSADTLRYAESAYPETMETGVGEGKP